MGVISNIGSLGAPELAEDLSTHLSIVKSMLDELHQTITSDGDAFVAKVAASYVMARDATRVQLRQQFADEAVRLKDISRQIEKLTASLERQEVKYEAAAKFFHLFEKTRRWLEESLARSWQELKQRQRDCDTAWVEGEKLKLAKREAEVQLQASRVKPTPLEQQLAHQVSLTDKSLQARARQEAEHIRHERLRMLGEVLSRLVNAEWPWHCSGSIFLSSSTFSSIEGLLIVHRPPSFVMK